MYNSKKLKVFCCTHLQHFHFKKNAYANSYKYYVKLLYCNQIAFYIWIVFRKSVMEFILRKLRKYKMGIFTRYQTLRKTLGKYLHQNRIFSAIHR